MRKVPWIDVALLVREAGFKPGVPAQKMVAICEEESRRAELLNDTVPVAEPDGSVSYGIACVNSVHLLPDGLLEGMDPVRLHRDHLYNLRAALIVSWGGTTFQPWTTYNDGLEDVNLRLAACALDGAARLLQERAWLRSCQNERDLARQAEAAAILGLELAETKIERAREALA